MNADGRRRGALGATGVTGPGTSVVRLYPASARSRTGRPGTPTATLSDRTFWIAWRTHTSYAAAPTGVVPASTSRGTHYAIVYVAPDTSAVIRTSRRRAHSGLMMMSASRMAAIGAAIRRLAARAAIVRSSGVN